MGKVTPIGKPIKRKCSMCGGTGTVPVNPRNPREGDKRCPSCNGTGEH